MKFSIFLPVRNGGEHFRQCVVSILEQTYREFQLVILDNASLDGSPEWISSLDESRVKVLTSDTMLSIQDSWKRIQHAQKCEFMTIIGHDDLLDRNYLDAMRMLIEKHPGAGLYQTHFRLIDSEGHLLRPSRAMPEQETPEEFLESRLRFQRDSYGTGYMCRSSDYERVGGIPGYEKLLFADDALWMKLMIGSWKATAKDELFSYRVHAGSTSFLPESDSLYEGLDSYVAFLQEVCIQNARIADVVKRLLPTYLITIYRWRFFPLRKNTEKYRLEGEALRNRIQLSASKVSQFLSTLDAKAGENFPELVRREVFSAKAYYSWYLRGRLGAWKRNLVGVD